MSLQDSAAHWLPFTGFIILAGFWDFDSSVSGDSVHLGNDAASHVNGSKHKEYITFISKGVEFRGKKINVLLTVHRSVSVQ
jgi:hypothetical protein